ncbi:hypothetical protein Tco_1165253, partial [Tanacetum coccineum]
MELENSQNNSLAKLPILKLGEYEMWEIRIKQYFQIQDYALWEVIENGNSWVPIPVIALESGPSTALKMTVPSTTEEKICKKNDLALEEMMLQRRHKRPYEASMKLYVQSSESLDLSCNRLQKLVSRLAILGVDTSPEDLNVKFLRSLPSEWGLTLCVVKGTVVVNNDDKNLAFLTTSSPSSTNPINTVNTGVSTGTTKVNTARSQLVHEDHEKNYDDVFGRDGSKVEYGHCEHECKKFYQDWKEDNPLMEARTAGMDYDKSKVDISTVTKLDICLKNVEFQKAKDNRNWKPRELIKGSTLKKQYDDLLAKLDDTGFKAATYKRGLSILEAQVVKYKESEVLFSEKIALLKRSVGHKDYLMGLVKTELEKIKEEKEGFEFKLAKFEKSSKDLDDLLASQVTDKSKKGFGYNVVPSPRPLILNRPTPLDLSYTGLEEFKQPEVNEYGPRDSSLKPNIVCDGESNNSKENIDDSLTQQPKTVTETSSVVSPLKVDKDWKEKFFHPANHVRVEEPKKARENTDAPIIEDWVSDDEEEVESIPKEEKKTDVPTATKKESVKTVKPSRRSVRYAEMYRSQRPRGNQRSWNGQKTNQLGCNFVFNNKACFICGNFDHIQYNCPNAYKHMVPRAVLMKTGLKTVKNAKPLSTVRSVNTARPFSTARSVNTVRPYNTAHPKSTVSCARPKSHFQNQAQSTVQRPFYKNTALTKRSNIENINTGKQTVNTVRPNVNTV